MARIDNSGKRKWSVFGSCQTEEKQEKVRKTMRALIKNRRPKNMKEHQLLQEEENRS